MQPAPRKGVATLALAAALGAFLGSSASLAQNPCEAIAEACRDAGFVRGDSREGNGIIVDCVNPIVQGRMPRRAAGHPLPDVDPQVVAACRARNAGAARPPSTSETPVAASMPAGVPPPTGDGQRHPNIVFILTDDLSWNLVQFMPHVLDMQKRGVTFSNYMVTDSLCCPSRSSIFTGRFPHNTGIFRNTGADGGYLPFRDRGLERTTFATALTAAGYRTAMMGKYLNGYLPAKHPPAPGWTTWAVAGHAYKEFDYSLNQNGKVVNYGHNPADYLTDVMGGLGSRFIMESGGGPFLLEVATFAPHAPYTPAPRDLNNFRQLRAPRTPAFNAAPDANAVTWLTKHTQLSDAELARIDVDFRKRAQSVLAIDALIGELRASVAAIGQEKNTYFVFSSDNGYHMGEHRLMPGKMTAYDTDIRVPLIVTGPGVPANVTIDEIVENIDLCPTFVELAGTVPPPAVDGRSLVPFLHGEKVINWRTAALIEHHGPHDDPNDPDAPALRSGNPPTYEAIRAKGFVYVEYVGGEREFHDLATDPQELLNSYVQLPEVEKAALHASVEALKNCHDAKNCEVADRTTAALRK